MVIYDERYFADNYVSRLYVDGNTITLGYHKSISYPRYETRARYLVEQGVIRPRDTVLLIGAGYNWLGEALQNYYCKVVATDSSHYIQSTYKGSDETEIMHRLLSAVLRPASIHRFMVNYSTPAPIGYGEILNEDSATTASRNRVAAHYSGKPNVLVLEDVLDDKDMTEEEQKALIDSCREYGAGLMVKLGGPDENGICHKVL